MDLHSHIEADVAIYETVEGGPRVPIGHNGQVRCPITFPDGSVHDGCLFTSPAHGQLRPGERARLRIEFLVPSSALPKLHPGIVLYLGHGRPFGSATAHDVRRAPTEESTTHD